MYDVFFIFWIFLGRVIYVIDKEGIICYICDFMFDFEVYFKEVLKVLRKLRVIV